jgi:hypothetical protein
VTDSAQATRPNGRTRDHWWQTPPDFIPYSRRVAGGVVFGALLGGAFVNAFNTSWGWLAAVLGLVLPALGIWMEWEDGY